MPSLAISRTCERTQNAFLEKTREEQLWLSAVKSLNLKLISATARGNVAQHVARNDDGSLAAKLDHFTDRVGIPSTQSLDHNISNLVAVVRHSSRILQLRRLFMPVERALFPEIDVPNQQDGNVHEHLCEAISPHLYRMPDHVPVNVSPGIQEDRFYVKQDKDHGYEVKLHGERLACVARRFHPALVSLLFSAIWAPPSD